MRRLREYFQDELLVQWHRSRDNDPGLRWITDQWALFGSTAEAPLFEHRTREP